MLHQNCSIYHIDRTIRETNTVVDDGQHEIFVNTKVNDGSDIAELMQCFMQKDMQNPKKKGFSIESICEIMRVTREHVEKIQKDLQSIKQVIERGCRINDQKVIDAAASFCHF